MQSSINGGGEVVLYEAPDGQIRLDVRLEQDTVWLTQAQMAELFGRERSVITKHVGSVFRERELEAKSVCANFAHTAEDGKTYQVDHYNLDVVISVGYRVKSKRGTQFRIWATRTLKDHLLRGYTLNEKRLREKGLGEIEQAVGLLARTLTQHALVTDEGRRLRRENLPALSLRIGRTGNRTNRTDSRTNSKKKDVERCRTNQTSQAPV